jgi:hypothetical protein
MKRITIPTRLGYPTADILVNNQHYELPSGVEIEVEDAVAEVIEHIIALEPKENPSAGGGGTKLYLHKYILELAVANNEEGHFVYNSIPIAFTSISNDEYICTKRFWLDQIDIYEQRPTLDIERMNENGEIHLLSGHSFIDDYNGFVWTIVGVNTSYDNEMVPTLLLYSDDSGHFLSYVASCSLTSITEI